MSLVVSGKGEPAHATEIADKRSSALESVDGVGAVTSAATGRADSSSSTSG